MTNEELEQLDIQDVIVRVERTRKGEYVVEILHEDAYFLLSQVADHFRELGFHTFYNHRKYYKLIYIFTVHKYKMPTGSCKEIPLGKINPVSKH